MCVDKMAKGETGPDEEKMMVAFQAFDALIPGLGVYTRIFRKLRDDLFGKNILKCGQYPGIFPGWNKSHFSYFP